jgi:hypothetical protein
MIIRLPMRKVLNLLEYYLLEFRQRDGNYYDRNIPGEGLLIWHIDKPPVQDGVVQSLVVDIESADGRWRDAGYPLGEVADPYAGSDNLDFWAHDPVYTDQHRGNLGDSADPFDVDRFTMFASDTNPSSLGGNGHSSVIVRATGIDGDAMIIDMQVAPPLVQITAISTDSDEAELGVAAGAEISVEYTLANTGGSTATELSSRLRTGDALVQIVKGTASFPNLPAGKSQKSGSDMTVKFRVNRDLSEVQEVSVILEIYQAEHKLLSQELRVIAKPSHLISGSVTDEDGEGIPNIRLEAFGRSGFEGKARTGEDGRYEIFVPEGEYNLVVHNEAAPRSRFLVVESDLIHDFVLPRLHTLSGIVTDPDGVGIGGARIVAFSESSGKFFETSDDGSFIAQVPRGVYRIQVEAPGFVSTEGLSVEVDGDTEFNISVEKGALVTIHLVSPTGENVSDVFVYLSGLSFSFSGDVTESTGEVALTVLPGWYTLVIQEPVVGIQPDPILFEVKRDTTVQVQLSSGPLVEGSVVLRDGSPIDFGQISFYSPKEGKETSAQVRDGTYSLMVAAGEYSVSVNRDGTQPLGTVVINADTTLVFIVDNPVSISGRITGLTAGDLESTWIQFQSLEGRGFGASNSVNGGVFAVDLVPGKYRVMLYRGSSALIILDSIRVEDSVADLDIHVAGDDHPVAGRIEVTKAERLVGAIVTFAAVDGTHWVTQEIGADGLFEVELPS